MKTIVGKNLKILREKSGFTQAQVADFLGINRSTYSNYESGDREAPLDILEKSADLLGCDLYLLFEEDEKVVQEMLVCAFRVDDISDADMEEIAQFKHLVKSYLKMDQLLQK